MIEAQVPVVPGLEDSIKDEKEALVIAKEMGFPVMLKAVAGGGGKGMRKVDKEEDFLFFAWLKARRRKFFWQRRNIYRKIFK